MAVHPARHRVLRVRRGGAHQASLRTSGTAGGWKRGRARGAIRFFSRTAKSAWQFLKLAGSRPRLRRGGPLPRRLRRSFLAARGDPSPKLRGRGCCQVTFAFLVFSGTPFPPQRPAAHHSGFIRGAIPRTFPSREPLRERPRPSRGPSLRQIAHRAFVEAGSSACRRTSALAQDEDGGIGISQKTRRAPCRASIPLPFPLLLHTRVVTLACLRARTPHGVPMLSHHPPRTSELR
jgi:hypothetical protein